MLLPIMVYYTLYYHLLHFSIPCAATYNHFPYLVLPPIISSHTSCCHLLSLPIPCAATYYHFPYIVLPPIITSHTLCCHLLSLSVPCAATYTNICTLHQQEKLKKFSVFGAGLLLGTSLAVIIPEGVHVMYMNSQG